MLFLAITRPATMFGVPFEGFLLNFLGTFLLYMWVGRAELLSVRGAMSLLTGVVIHFVMRAMMSIDHNMFRIFVLSFVTRGGQPSGVSVLWAMTGKRGKAAEVGSSV